MNNIQLTLHYDKSYLITCLRANLETHKKDYADAKKVYWQDLRTKLSETLEHAVNEDDTKNYHVYLPAPINNEKEYRKLIALLSSAQEDRIELTSAQYNQIVNDETDFSAQSKSSFAVYNNKGK